MDEIKLFCFPYAGGSAMIYKKWRPFLSPHINLIPVELSGRGKRITEPLYLSMAEMVEDVYSIVEKQLSNDTPYAMFGHSMGSMIVYQLAQKIRRNGTFHLPSHIFFSGRGAPHVVRADQKQYSKMPMNEFKKEVIELGGTLPEFFDHPDLLEIFLPLLKNDFFLAETRLCNDDEIDPLPNDITVLVGKDEDLMPEQITEWKKHTQGKCTINYLNGGHFFINSQTGEVTQVINEILELSVVTPTKLKSII